MPDVQITLPRDEVGQILDGLEVLADQWDATAGYFETGAAEPGAIIREARDGDEAANMARVYRDLIERIRRQLPDLQRVHHG